MADKSGDRFFGRLKLFMSKMWKGERLTNVILVLGKSRPRNHRDRRIVETPSKYHLCRNSHMDPLAYTIDEMATVIAEYIRRHQASLSFQSDFRKAWERYLSAGDNRTDTEKVHALFTIIDRLFFNGLLARSRNVTLVDERKMPEDNTASNDWKGVTCFICRRFG